MLQFHVGFCRSGSNVAHKVRRYINLFVAPGGVINTKRSITPPKELASDVRGGILEKIHVASTNDKGISNGGSL